MKNTGCFVVILLISIHTIAMAQANDPQLVIPAYGKTEPTENKIFYPGYAYQLSRQWPRDLSSYQQVLFGGSKTFVKLRINGREVTLNLDLALKQGDIEIYSITTPFLPRQPGLIFEPKLGLSLLSMTTGGLILSHAAAPGFYADTSVIHCLGDQDTDAGLVMSHDANQHCIWEKVYGKQLADPAGRRALLAAYYQDMIKSNRLPGYYRTGLEGDTIRISAEQMLPDSQKNFKPYFNEDGASYFMVHSIIADLTEVKLYCRLKSDSLLDTLKIAGMYKGILPVRFIFTTPNKIVFSGTLTDSVIHRADSAVKIKLRLDYSLGAKPDPYCRLSFNKAINYPGANKGVVIFACGLKTDPELESFFVGL